LSSESCDVPPASVSAAQAASVIVTRNFRKISDPDANRALLNLN
jgi:hypothetical protein